jgi:bacterioferritin-associated ferredoxin
MGLSNSLPETFASDLPAMTPCGRETCHDCPERFLCHCLQVTESEVVDTIVNLGLRTIDELQRYTGAGGGCTACHRRISLLIESYSAEPICSVR